jgi:hypothetical protein
MLSRFLVVMGAGYLVYALYFVFQQAYLGAVAPALGAAAALIAARVAKRGPSVALASAFLAVVIAVGVVVWINVTSLGSVYDPERRDHAQNAR